MKLKNVFLMASLILSMTSLFISCNDNNDPFSSPPEKPVDPNEMFRDKEEIIYLCDFQIKEETDKLVKIYKLDLLTPTNEMQQFGFKDQIAWLLQMKDSYTSANSFAASTSSFSPAGQANAWLVTTQIKIPAEGYVLSWKSESLNSNKRDGMKIFISTTGGNPSSDFPTTPEWEIQEESSGATENIDGEWIDHEISLDKYAGKTVWIAFVNQSNDKYILCLDDICVKKKLNFLVDTEIEKITTENTVSIKGSITANTQEISAYTVHYTTADSIVYSEHYSGLSLKPGQSHQFKFKNQLAIKAKGQYIPYKIWAEVEGMEKVGLIDSIAAYTFMPQHKIILEEGTGSWCGYCPLGILAIENLQTLYAKNVIAIAVHNNDQLTVADYDKALQFSSFPIGLINRKYIGEPMSSSNNDYSFEGETTFLSLFKKALEEIPNVEIKITQAKLIENNIQVETETRFALTPSSNQYSLTYVLIENDVEITQPQQNNLCTSDKIIFGRFGKDQEMGKPIIKGYKFQEVARGIYPSFTGAKNVLPTSLKTDTVYPIEYNIDLNKTTIKNADKLHIIVMITDTATGVVLNADQFAVSQ